MVRRVYNIFASVMDNMSTPGEYFSSLSDSFPYLRFTSVD
jgi:hypothetical protein